MAQTRQTPHQSSSGSRSSTSGNGSGKAHLLSSLEARQTSPAPNLLKKNPTAEASTSVTSMVLDSSGFRLALGPELVLLVETVLLHLPYTLSV